ncbi:MAG: hypothetical protein QM676_09310 [Novosphingobium sp.]
MDTRNAEKKSFTTAGWILFTVSALLTGLGFWWFKAQLATLGYAG